MDYINNLRIFMCLIIIIFLCVTYGLPANASVLINSLDRDQTFGDNGYLTFDIFEGSSFFRDIIYNDGKVYVIGYGRGFDGDDLDIVVLSLNEDGSLNKSFGVTSPGYTIFDYDNSDDFAYASTICEDNIIIVGATQKRASGRGLDFMILKVDMLSGSLNHDFGEDGFIVEDLSTQDFFYDVEVINNKIYAIGTIGAERDQEQLVVLSWDLDGSNNSDFNNIYYDSGDCYSWGSSLAQDNKGHLFAGGFINCVDLHKMSPLVVNISLPQGIVIKSIVPDIEKQSFAETLFYYNDLLYILGGLFDQPVLGLHDYNTLLPTQLFVIALNEKGELAETFNSGNIFTFDFGKGLNFIYDMERIDELFFLTGFMLTNSDYDLGKDASILVISREGNIINYLQDNKTALFLDDYKNENMPERIYAITKDEQQNFYLAGYMTYAFFDNNGNKTYFKNGLVIKVIPDLIFENQRTDGRQEDIDESFSNDFNDVPAGGCQLLL